MKSVRMKSVTDGTFPDSLPAAGGTQYLTTDHLGKSMTDGTFLDSLPAASGTQYLTTDHLGSTRLVTNAGGTATQTFDYLPFGEEVGGTSLTGPTQRFTGQERDTESGLDNFKARYASAPQGRFQSPDPAGMFVADPTNPQSWNLYAYVMNNPLKYIDPTGTCTVVDGNYEEDGGDPCPDNPPTSVTVGGGTPDPVEPIVFILPGEITPSSPPQQPPPTQPPPSPSPQQRLTCQQQRILKALPGAQFTGGETNQGGHQQFNIATTPEQLASAQFATYANPFGGANGYHNSQVFNSVHVSLANY